MNSRKHAATAQVEQCPRQDCAALNRSEFIVGSSLGRQLGVLAPYTINLGVMNPFMTERAEMQRCADIHCSATAWTSWNTWGLPYVLLATMRVVRKYEGSLKVTPQHNKVKGSRREFVTFTSIAQRTQAQAPKLLVGAQTVFKRRHHG